MRSRLFVSFSTLVTVLAIGGPAQALPAVQVDMSDAFNKDVIVNGTTVGNIDNTQTSVDISETSFITQAAAEVLPNCTADPDGLPNKGRFAKNADHPFVDLAYDNSKNGRNARRSPGADNYRVSVPRYRYRSMHVFATSGNGNSTMKVKLIFVEGDPIEETLTVLDWYNEATEGYSLIDNRDRALPDGSHCYDVDVTEMFGFKVQSDSGRKLKAVIIKRPDSDGGAVLNVFGMTGKRAG
jgi:hypothetical protein